MLTSGAERCLVGVSGGSLLSCAFSHLAIGGSSNCLLQQVEGGADHIA